MLEVHGNSDYIEITKGNHKKASGIYGETYGKNDILFRRNIEKFRP